KEDYELSEDRLIELDRNGDKNKRKLVEQIGDNIGKGINNIINTINPEQIIIGNRIASAQAWLSETVKNKVVTHAMDFHQKDLKLDFSILTTHSSALGVVAFSIENFLEESGKRVDQPHNV